MSFWEAVRLAFEALGVNRLRSALTILGTVVAVVAIVAVISITQGLNRYVAQELLDVGSHTFTIDKFGDVTDAASYFEALKRRNLRTEDADFLREVLTTAEVVVPATGTRVDVDWRGERIEDTQLRGMGPGYAALGDAYRLHAGRHFTADELRGAARVALLGSEVADQLFGAVDPIGRRVRVGRESFWVIGVLTEQGSVLGQSQDNRVIVPISAFEKHWGRRRSISITLRARTPELFETAQDEATTMLKIRRGLQPWSEPDFGVRSAEAFYEVYQRTTSLFYLGILVVVGLSLVVGGIVMMNIMLVSVTERTREIGIRKAVGARRRDVLMQFLVEACALSGSGGLVGIAVGGAVALLVDRVTPLPARLEPWSIVLSLALALAVGVVAGIYPAARAARLIPVAALGYEK